MFTVHIIRTHIILPSVCSSDIILIKDENYFKHEKPHPQTI